MLATRLILSQLNKIYVCVIKWSRMFYIETGILVYCLVYLEDNWLQVVENFIFSWAN